MAVPRAQVQQVRVFAPFTNTVVPLASVAVLVPVTVWVTVVVSPKVVVPVVVAAHDTSTSSAYHISSWVNAKKWRKIKKHVAKVQEHTIHSTGSDRLD